MVRKPFRMGDVFSVSSILIYGSVTLIMIVGGYGLFLWLRRTGNISNADVKRFLSEGALVVDVRPANRYAEKHLTGVVNLSALSIVESVVPLVHDETQVILCHCETGGLSGLAVRQLRKAGYCNAFNLGSYKRAATFLESDI